MHVARTIDEVRAFLAPLRIGKGSIGFCPTMGALHEGHLSLVQRCRAECGVTVASVFVNPTQFGPEEDLHSYPRDEERDLRLLVEAGCDLTFLPDAATMYPPGSSTSVTVASVTEELCGAKRPSHFSGVATVVLKLFNIVQPDRAYFGFKDAQQYFVVSRMVADLDVPVDVRPCPIIREDDGLAMSSRNLRLDEQDRREAPALYRGLCSARSLFAKGERRSVVLVDAVRSSVAATSGQIDYVQLVDVPSMRPLETVEVGGLLACAVHYGDVRLIDNTLLGEVDQCC